MKATRTDESLTYGSYLRVPELLHLQTPLAEPPVPDEVLFILGQQAQELWFKQILHDLHAVVDALLSAAIPEAVRLLNRAAKILGCLALESEVLETISVREFHAFRGYLRAASGLQSEQFRELELASGLRDEGYLRMVSRLIDLDAVQQRWPLTVHDAFLQAITALDPDPAAALSRVYTPPGEYPDLYLLCEALMEYEMRFGSWRYHHIQVVERIIGNRSPGTGGSAGSSYLFRTLGYQFFPELWEVRNRLTERGAP